ncbi:MAG: OmpA family protein [Roseivirga sp.]|nr:OmpA family protein [Roseivirga sp.]
MRSWLLSILTILSISFSLSGQELHTRSKKAIEFYEQARDLDHVGNWYNSYDLLKQALAKDGGFDEAVLLAHQILIKRGDWPSADSLYAKHQSRVEKDFRNRMLLDGAFYNYSEGNYDKAFELKASIDGTVKEVDQRLFELVKSSIDYAREKKEEARQVDFEELEAPVNDQSQQYFPSITSNDMLVYTVRGKIGRGDENIFFSQWDGTAWTKPESISATINTDRNEGTASISADGRTIVFTGCNKPNGVGSCDLYISYREADAWSRPQLLSEAINTLYWESQPSLSQDGRQLYFVSKRPDGLGGQDIWWSELIGGEWTPAINLGSTVNTSFDDCSPYIHPNAKTLFFASRGRPGFGGYDLYRTEQTARMEWMEPLNLGYPINTHGNQVGYTISADGWAYYSENNSERQTKLFRFKMPPDLLPEAPVFALTGYISDADNKEPLSAEVNISDLMSDSTLLITRSEKRNGQFKLLMEANDAAYLYIKKKGYLLYKANLDELFDSTGVAEIPLVPLKIGERIVLTDILFEFNSAALDSKATKELDQAVSFLLTNPEVKIEIAGHTDSQGNDDYNIKLSNSRAASVYRYFLEKSVPKENLVFKGYGESQPIAVGTDASLAALNRRIELIITAISK